jgi:hypothetical protein
MGFLWYVKLSADPSVVVMVTNSEEKHGGQRSEGERVPWKT